MKQSKSVRFDEWVLTMLNETIRADAEFQINQRSAWQEFSRRSELFNGIDLTAGLQHQRNLFVNEMTFEFDLVPDRPGFWDKLISLLLFRPPRKGSFYRLKMTHDERTDGLHARVVIRRDVDNRYQPEVTLSPKDSIKPEDIHLAGVARGVTV